ncbi:MAG: SUMF1/EgtB/PvdO family nonheme iron enzyme, partial [Planctomycetes bacterium]|nr:SUMF1/EgtB/PvdO family nonheme iron enzyme [Planctomycetota bacterium]
IAMKALAQKPPNRYPSADAFADDLAAFLARQPVSAYRAPVPIRIVAWVRRHVVLFSIAVVVSLAVGATIGIVYGRNSLESRATQAREGEAKRAAEKRLADARSGRDLALEAAKKAHEARLGALRDYSEPFEHVFVYPPPPEEPIESQRELLRQLAKTTYNPSADFWVAKASEDWQAAAAQARSSLLTLRERNDSLDAQELEWALELALATERALFTSAWIEKSRQTAKLDPEAGPRFYRQVVQLLADIEKPDRLGPDHAMVLRARELLKGSGKLTTSPLPADTTAKLLEYVTTQFPAFGREVVSENISPAGESVNLPLGSYSLEVARGEERFFFPVLVERGRTSSVEVELPEQIPEGFAWIPPGDFLEGGDAPDAWPRHRCFLEKGFFLARTEVTLERYIEFLRRVPDDRTREAFAPAYYDGHQLYPVLHADLSFIRPYDELEHPVYGVSRVDAEAYAKWLSENDPAFDYRLPSEEEWARAAAGADGRILVWGDHFDKSLAIVQGNGKYEYRGPVGSSPADSSPFGIFDMAGNLSEWTASDLPGERAVVRGACWGDAESAVRVSGRNLSHARNEKGYVETGFRLVAFPKRGG